MLAVSLKAVQAPDTELDLLAGIVLPGRKALFCIVSVLLQYPGRHLTMETITILAQIGPCQGLPFTIHVEINDGRQ